jgi:dTDP-4-dehydrorhamnose reductase
VDFCENHPEEANRVNRDGTRYLAEAAQQVGAKFVFVSTDFVFDGTGAPPYHESDLPRPQSVYAESKLAGERETLVVSPNNVVVRPSVIYSWIDTRQRKESSSGKGMNFGTWAVEEVAAGRSVRIINDQVASPTLADDLAGAILALVDNHAGGTFHAAGLTAVTRYDFTVRLIQRLNLDATLVQPVATSDLAQKAQRPRNSSLSSERLVAMTGYRMMDLDAALAKFAAAFQGDPGSPGRR